MRRRNFISILLAGVLAGALAFAGAPSYYPPAIGDFDGAADYLSRGSDLTGNADGKVGTLSAWVRFDGSDGANQAFLSNVTNNFYIRKQISNKLHLVGKQVGGASALNVESSTTYTASASWLHLLASWDMAVGWHLYVNDVSDKGTETNFVDAAIDYTGGGSGIAVRRSNLADKLNGAISEFYFALEYLDLSDPANRRKFIDANGYPVGLGPSCSTPTGTASIICMRTQFNNAGLNDGTGGDFVINGAPTYTQGSVPIPLITWRPGTKRGRGGRGGRSTIQQEKRN